MVSPMKQTFEASTLHIDETTLKKRQPFMPGNNFLKDCDAAGSHDPAVAVYVTPKGDFVISDTYEYGSTEQSELSHTLGVIAVDVLPSLNQPIRHLRTVA